MFRSFFGNFFSNYSFDKKCMFPNVLAHVFPNTVKRTTVSCLAFYISSQQLQPGLDAGKRPSDTGTSLSLKQMKALVSEL